MCQKTSCDLSAARLTFAGGREMLHEQFPPPLWYSGLLHAWVWYPPQTPETLLNAFSSLCEHCLHSNFVPCLLLISERWTKHQSLSQLLDCQRSVQREGQTLLQDSAAMSLLPFAGRLKEENCSSEALWPPAAHMCHINMSAL